MSIELTEPLERCSKNAIQCLHHLLTEQAMQQGEAPAFIFGEQTMSYRELDRRAETVAWHLHSSGVEVGDAVGVLLDRSFDLIVALFAVLKVGAVCVPLDPADAEPRRRFALTDSGAKWVVTQEALRGILADAEVCALVIDTIAAESRALTLDRQVDPEDAAFLFYTSGSTGTPKGVVLTHRALLAGQQWLQSTFCLTPEDRQLLQTTISVTNLVREVFWPVLCGCPCVILPPGKHKDIDAYLNTIARSGVTVILVVPAMLRNIIERSEFRLCSSLRYVFSSSDVMPGDLPEQFYATGCHAELYNIYGLTEALYAAYYRCPPGKQYMGVVPIGTPAELRPRILSSDMLPVPQGGIGLLYLSGAGIAREYHKRPDLNAQKFFTSPSEPGVKLFATGDLASLLPDGTIQLLGRSDNQFKIRGFLVDPGEVEGQLRQHPAIRDAVAVGRQDRQGHVQLVAYVLPSGEDMPELSELRRFLAERLPEYMVPSAFVALDELPLTHNGKVDRQALQHRAPTPLPPSTQYRAPRNERERALCQLWCEALNLPRIGIDDNFFERGGDSILAVLISARAARAGLSVASTQVFRTPTVATLSAALDEIASEPMKSAETHPGPCLDCTPFASGDSTMETSYPLSPMQQGMLFHSILEPDSGVYFEQFVYVIQGRLSPERYVEAWRKVVAKNPILRTAIVWEGLDEPLQYVHRHAELHVENHDLRNLGKEAQTHAIKRFLQEDRSHGFELSEAPLFRIGLLRTATNTWRLVVSYHHLLLDAWSVFILLRQVLAFYEGDPTTNPAPEPYQFRDYILYSRQIDPAPSKRFWSEQLRGYTRLCRLSLSKQSGRHATRIDDHVEQRMEMPRETAATLRQIGRKHGLTLNSIVQGAWALLLGLRTGREDILFGITISDRPVALPAVEDIVGIFINTLPKRVRIERTRPLIDWLQGIQKEQVAARNHEQHPLVDIQKLSEFAPGEPLFESLLIFENFPKSEQWEQGQEICIRQERYVGWTNYPFAIEAMPEDEGLLFQVKYDATVFNASQITDILEDFRMILTWIATRPELCVEQIPGLRESSHYSDGETGGEEPAETPTQIVEQERCQVTVQPQNAVEARLVALWRRLLKIETVGITENFFDLGGHSLLALQLFNAIQQEFGIKLPLATLFKAPTIRELASVLERSEREARCWSSLVALQPYGEKPPFFCVHSLGANLLDYRVLAQHLGPDQPVYGFQAQGLDGIRSPLTSVAEMAARYIAEMRMVQPHGPYRLGGRCAGGPIAFEMAQQLISAGESVAALIMIDSVCTMQRHTDVLRGTPYRKFDRHLGTILLDDSPRPLPYLLGWLKSKLVPRSLLRRQNVSQAYRQTDPVLDRVTAANRCSITDYAPTLYPGRVVQILSRRASFRTMNDPRLDWEALARGGMEVHFVGGNHDTMMQEPYAAELAVILRRCLERGD